ncbi:MAG: L-serine ammonia-lyase, iron-sulfur-dependent, subunit alpha [Candidatus Izemoplasmatales bacterium]|nr:L-serine ammonia-lyase, iron-sulfur-dependent, subunit alpha [Candidatus Izemoplasmatales bacterium]
MKSIRELYKTGYGPSSSHTMGPQKACSLFKKTYSDAIHFKVILYGSLAMTGKGHLTDRAIEDTLIDVQVVFDFKTVMKHPNTMDIYGFSLEGKTFFWRVYSIGGGAIQIDNEGEFKTLEIYPHHNFEEIKAYCQLNNLRLFQYVERFEGLEIWDFFDRVYETMNDVIQRGLSETGLLPGELKVQRKAKQLISSGNANEPAELAESRIVSAYAFAAAEENAAGHLMVTAPTCGSSGVIPAVMRYLEEKHHLTKTQCLEGLATAGLIGNIIKHNATISGAIAGCQAEIGSACAMASAMHAEMFGFTITQIEYASEISLEHHLGLTCDPILGYVQIPCIERNAVAALRAIDNCRLAYYLSESRKISLDMVIDTMYQTGQDIRTKYRETGSGGLALLYAKIKKREGEGN